jgi:hypothetical protein
MVVISLIEDRSVTCVLFFDTRLFFHGINLVACRGMDVERFVMMVILNNIGFYKMRELIRKDFFLPLLQISDKY